MGYQYPGLDEIEKEEIEARKYLERVREKKEQWHRDHADEIERDKKIAREREEEIRKNRYPHMRLEVKGLDELPLISDMKGQVFDLKNSRDFLDKEDCDETLSCNGNFYWWDEQQKSGQITMLIGGNLTIYKSEKGFSLHTDGAVNIHSPNVRPLDASVKDLKPFWNKIEKAESFVEANTGRKLPSRITGEEEALQDRKNELLEVVSGEMKKGKDYFLSEDDLPKLRLNENCIVDLRKFKDVLAFLKNGEELVVGRNPLQNEDSASICDGMIAIAHCEDTADISRKHAVISRDENGKLRVRDVSRNGTSIEKHEKDNANFTSYINRTKWGRH